MYGVAEDTQAPYGYSSDASGNMVGILVAPVEFTHYDAQGGALILAGIIGALVTSPVFDKVLTHHLGITTKILVPILGVAWFSLIWDGECASVKHEIQFPVLMN